jgi:hypothetical protein
VPLKQALSDHPELIEYGRYAMQLEPYLERFGRGQVLPVFFDHLRAHPQACLERVCAFIGYGSQPRWRTDLAPQNVSNERLRKSRLRDAIVHAPVISTIRRRFVPQWVRDRIKRLWMMNERPLLDGQDHERVVGIFDADLRRLGQWLGTSLSCATFRERTRARPLEWV